MNDQEQIQADKAAEQEYLRAEDELKAHEDEPLNASLHVRIQPFTLTRLYRLLAKRGISLDYAVNDILKDWLYMEGE